MWSKDDFKASKRNFDPKIAARNLVDVVKMLDITFWLHAGTMLGYWRERGIIKDDTDVDIAIYATDRALLMEIIKNLPDFELIRDNDYLVSILRDNNYVDFYLYKVVEGGFQGPCGDVLTSEYLNLSKVDFLGVQVGLLAQPERVIDQWYGPNWNEPCRDAGRPTDRRLL